MDIGRVGLRQSWIQEARVACSKKKGNEYEEQGSNCARCRERLDYFFCLNRLKMAWNLVP